MLATVLWECILTEFLTIAAVLSISVAVAVDLFLIVCKSVAPWKKTTAFFAVSELAVSIVSCWLGASFAVMIGWIVLSILTAVILFVTVHLHINKWETK